MDAETDRKRVNIKVPFRRQIFYDGEKDINRREMFPFLKNDGRGCNSEELK